MRLSCFVESEGKSLFLDIATKKVNCKNILMGSRGSHVKNFINIYIFDQIVQLPGYHLEKIKTVKDLCIGMCNTALLIKL